MYTLIRIVGGGEMVIKDGICIGYLHESGEFVPAEKATERDRLMFVKYMETLRELGAR